MLDSLDTQGRTHWKPVISPGRDDELHGLRPVLLIPISIVCGGLVPQNELQYTILLFNSDRGRRGQIRTAVFDLEDRGPFRLDDAPEKLEDLHRLEP